MKKRLFKHWQCFFIAILAVLLTIGCTTEVATDTTPGSTNETTVSETQKPTIATQNKTVDYGTTLNYSDVATVTDEDSDEVQLSITSSGLEGITFDDNSQTIVLSAVGNFEIEFTATDESGNVATENVIITVEDHVAPTITLSSTAFSLTAGDSAPNYISVASASDNVDGDITSTIKVDSSKVNLNSAGTYEVTYTVTDSSGNTVTQTATVTVIAKSTTSSSSSTTVYVLITKTGECYHTRKCGNGNFFEVTLEEALRRGLRKCKKCYP